MKKAKWAALGISLLIAVSPPANGQTATSAFNPSNGVVYIIRNVETGQFLRCSSHSLNAAYFTDSIDSDYHLWTFKKSGNGWLMYNNGKEGYLTDTPTSSTYLGKTNSDRSKGTTWYISDYSFKKANNNDYKKGYIVSSDYGITPPPRTAFMRIRTSLHSPTTATIFAQQTKTHLRQIR